MNNHAPVSKQSTSEPKGNVKSDGKLSIFTLNINHMKSKVLQIEAFLVQRKPDIIFFTETELEADLSPVFEGYSSLFPPPNIKDNLRRVVGLVRAGIVHEQLRLPEDLASPGLQMIGIRVPTVGGRNIVAAGVYRQFGDGGIGSTDFERDQLIAIPAISEFWAADADVVLMGDFNVDKTRENDDSYNRRGLLRTWNDEVEKAGLDYHHTGTTYHSYAERGGVRSESTLHHVYTSSLLTESSRVLVLDDAISDHWPLLSARLTLGSRPQARDVRRCGDATSATPTTWPSTRSSPEEAWPTWCFRMRCRWMPC